MKYSYFLIIATILNMLCCKQSNKMHQDETPLFKQLRMEEEAVLLDKPSLNQERTSEHTMDKEAFLLDDSPGISSPKRSNIQKNEGIRSFDPQRPPVVLDILKARNDLREININHIGEDIKYVPIRFQKPLDSLWNRIWDFDFLITENNIVAYQQSYGITQFDLYGNFKKQIAENKFYYTWIPKYNVPMISPDDQKNFVGSKGGVHAIGDQIYYQYYNANEKQAWMMQYDASTWNLSGQITNGMEEGRFKNAYGEKLFDINVEKGRGILKAPDIFPLNKEGWVSVNPKMDKNNTGDFLTISNSLGDTISTYRDHDPVIDFPYSSFRNSDEGGHYFFEGKQHIRQAFNDTIYIMSSSNKLIPKYIIDFGNMGIKSSMEGVSKVSLKEKYILHRFVESDKYLFIMYTQDYDCVATAKSGTLKYNACIYDKANASLFHVYMDEEALNGRPNPPNNYIANNNDLPFWPKSTTQKGVPYTWFKGIDLKELPATHFSKNEHLNTFIKNIKDEDYLIMILQ